MWIRLKICGFLADYNFLNICDGCSVISVLQKFFFVVEIMEIDILPLVIMYGSLYFAH